MPIINNTDLVEIRTQYKDIIKKFTDMEQLIKDKLDLVAETCHGGQFCHGGSNKTPDLENPINEHVIE